MKPMAKIALGIVIAEVGVEVVHVVLFGLVPLQWLGSMALLYRVYQMLPYLVCLLAGFLAARRGTVVASVCIGALAGATHEALSFAINLFLIFSGITPP